MAIPSYEPSYSFTDYQTARPSKPLPAPELDNELWNISRSIDGTIDGLRDIRRDDGKLQNGIVTQDSLSVDLRLGLLPPVLWTPFTPYTIWSSVFYENKYYRAAVNHISGLLFDPTKWIFLADISAGVVADNGGWWSAPTLLKGADYAVQRLDAGKMLTANAAVDITFSFPPAVSIADRLYPIRNIGSARVLLKAAAGESINAAASPATIALAPGAFALVWANANGLIMQQVASIPGTAQVGARLTSIDENTFAWLGGGTDKVNFVAICGQSNAAGARTGGPNPANPLVKVWDGSANAWGSSDITQMPWTAGNPVGNAGNNNSGLAFAHRLAVETGRPTYLVFYFVGGTSIDHWVFDGNAGGNGDFYTAFKARVEAALATPELAGKTKLDALIFSQGEEDYTMDFATYLGKFTTLNNQYRAETWFGTEQPIFVTGMSGLHDRYPVEKAQQFYCAQVNAKTRYVNSKGMQTDYDATGTGDYTHFQGQSLWDMGYNRIWAAYNDKLVSPKASSPLFWGRGSGTATPADGQVISSFHSLTSWESRDLTAAAVNSLVAATGSISWGYQCAADGNYTYAFGYLNSTGNLCNYTLVAGRENVADDNGDYSGVFGFQNTVSGNYSFAAGRGHVVASPGSAVTGTFSEFTTAQTDPVTLQHGVGATSSSRRNALTGRGSGALRVGASLPVANLPSAANAGAGFQMFANNGNDGQGAQVISDGAVWRKADTLSGYKAETLDVGVLNLTPILSAYLHNFKAVVPSGNITVTPLTTNAYAGARFEIWAPTNLNAKTFTVNGTTRTAGSAAVLVYDGAAWIG